MFIIYNETEELYLKSACCENVWTADIAEAMTWATAEEATAAATAASICTCWVAEV